MMDLRELTDAVRYMDSVSLVREAQPMLGRRNEEHYAPPRSEVFLGGVEARYLRDQLLEALGELERLREGVEIAKEAARQQLLTELTGLVTK